MNFVLSPFGGVGAQFFNNDGVILSGGLIYSYVAGSSTPATTYTTSIGSIAHSNPIVLDASGRVPGGEIWLTYGYPYKFILKDSTGALIGTYDNIGAVGQGGSVQDYTGDGSTTTFALPVGTSLVYNIYINGVYQNKNTYSIVGGNIVFTQAPPYTSKIEVQV